MEPKYKKPKPRNVWEINPVTRVKKSKKRYNRAKEKRIKFEEE